MRRIGFLAAVALLGSIACDSVLDIEAPTTRPGDMAGQGGEPVAVAGTSGRGGTSAGASAAIAAGAGGEGASAEQPTGDAGAGGSGPTPDCETGAERCTELAPEICDEAGHWVSNLEEAVGDCPVRCSAGKCLDCADGDKRCASCEEGDQNCSPRLPQTCVDGAWRNDDTACKAYCDVDSGECVQPPSCTDDNVLGTTCQNGVSCCASLLVPGGDFLRDFDLDQPEKILPARVSPFYLDKFEVTVARFRQFVLGYEQLGSILTEGAGKAKHIAEDRGWNDSLKLPAKPALLTALTDCTGTTWAETSTPDDDKRPINCVPHNVAYAFCIWDLGRLPTETEWNFAAAGGSEQRVYPWKAPLDGPPVSAEFANYDFANPGPIMVGLTPRGDGRWGHSDLAGNVAEWVLDYKSDQPKACNDCLITTPNSERGLRGGSYEHQEFMMTVSLRNGEVPDLFRASNGFRCARDLE